MGFDFGRLIVVGVTILIAFIAYTSQIFIFWRFLGGWGRDALYILGPFNIIVLMIFWNYYLACVTDPGRPPKGWKPAKVEEESNAPLKMKRRLRFCKNCNVFKPPRTHHCSSCRRCVLRMDHHCPWINNCVGHYNYGHFIRFIIYVDIGTLYCFILLCMRIYNVYSSMRSFRYYISPTNTELVFLALNLVFDFGVLFSVGILSLFQLYGISTNATTIEGWEKDKVKKMIRRGKIPPLKYPFNVGLINNLKSVLGPNPLLWFWPQTMVGDGIDYPCTEGSDPYTWPPKDPDDRPSIFSRKYREQQESIAYSRQHVRRGSEGYIVQDITMEDRMRMLQNLIDAEENGISVDTFNAYQNPPPQGCVGGHIAVDEQDEYSSIDSDPEIYSEDDFEYDAYNSTTVDEYNGERDSRGNIATVSSEYIQSRNTFSEDTLEQRRSRSPHKDDNDDHIPLSQLIAKKQLAAMGKLRVD
ncbi:uncharacterized protein VTP21DRAFT_8635 [Calcarisporiella thermophila]|uniref:uncharacterized protein n=1 Tax=Calcarisporiella thermophila TaxID=911321 RepID=UPI00374233C3